MKMDRAMTLLDRGILLATGLIAIYMIWQLILKFKSDKKETSDLFFITSFTVLLVSGLLLIGLGWSILANPLIAIVATIIPFALAIGLVVKFYPKYATPFMVVMAIGFVSIAVTKLLGVGCGGKIVYPLFHAVAGLSMVVVSYFAIKAEKATSAFYLFLLGDVLIGTGGIALAFLKQGKQLLFFSGDVVLMILAPLLFLMALCFAVGLVKGQK
jgi:hypothetical protein